MKIPQFPNIDPSLDCTVPVVQILYVPANRNRCIRYMSSKKILLVNFGVQGTCIKTDAIRIQLIALMRIQLITLMHLSI